MKQLFKSTLFLLAAAALTVGCAKEINDPEDQEVISDQEQTATQDEEQANPAAKQITISATLLDTKVTFNPSFDANNKPTGMSHTWETGDKLRVADANDDTNYEEFDLVSGAGSATGTFSGNEIVASSYNVTVIPVTSPSSIGETQTQIGDGSTAHLKFVAGATGVTDLKNFTLDETSNIIGFIAKLPAGATQTINQVVIDKSTDDFVTTSTLTINLGSAEDLNNDDILEVYANVPSGWEIAANTKMFIRFKNTTPNASHSVYTRYQEFSSAATITPGKFNFIKMNCVNTDKYAGKDDDGTAAHPYLIADKYQLNSVNGELNAASAGTTVYFKLIDDIDLSGIANWTPINAGSRSIFFEGNNKKISNLTVTSSDTYPGLFSILYGTVQNLEIKDASITASTNKATGIVTGYICSNNSTLNSCNINHVTITSPTISGGIQYCGAIGGLIGTHATREFSISISYVTISGANISTSNDCGGLLGFTQSVNTTGVSANRTLNISNINILDSEISTTGTGKNVGGLIGKVDDPNATISDVNIKGTKVSGTSKALTVGGIVGWVSDAADFDCCTYEKNGETTATVTGTANIAEAEATIRYTGGLVGSLTGAASFDDCHVKDASITLEGTSASDDARYVGGAFGSISASATIGGTTACTVESISITNGKNYTGGFVGYLADGTIKQCTASGEKITAKSQIGGFAGYIASGTLNGNTTSIEVDGVENVGGFVGQCAGGTFQDNSGTWCEASGNVTGSGNSVGGFVGYAGGGSFTNCKATGNITTSGINVGGFVGYSLGTIPYDTCKYEGTGSNNSFVKCTASSTNTFLGGFCGDMGTYTSIIQNCEVTNCKVESTQHQPYVGGFFGRGGNSGGGNTGTITKCSVSGVSVIGAQYTGGFAGTLYTNTSRSKVISSEVSSYNGNVGSFVGYLRYCTVENCYTTTTVTAQANGTSVSAFIGYLRTGATSGDYQTKVYRCYTSGTVVKNGKTVNSCGGFFGTVQTNCLFDYCICWNSLDFWGTKATTISDGGHNYTKKNFSDAGNKLYNSDTPNGATNIINSYWDTTNIWDVTNNDGLPRLK